MTPVTWAFPGHRVVGELTPSFDEIPLRIAVPLANGVITTSRNSGHHHADVVSAVDRKSYKVDGQSAVAPTAGYARHAAVNVLHQVAGALPASPRLPFIPSPLPSLATGHPFCPAVSVPVVVASPPGDARPAVLDHQVNAHTPRFPVHRFTPPAVVVSDPGLALHAPCRRRLRPWPCPGHRRLCPPAICHFSGLAVIVSDPALTLPQPTAALSAPPFPPPQQSCPSLRSHRRQTHPFSGTSTPAFCPCK